MTVVELAAKHSWNMPTTCPACGTALEISDNHKQFFCPNDFCKSRYSGRIFKWANKLKIMELGLTTIEKIQERGYFSTIGNMYAEACAKNDPLDLATMLGKVWDNIKAEITAHRSATLAQFVSGYNIAGVGEKLVQRVLDAKNIRTFDELMDCKDYTCDGIGQVTADKLRQGLEVFEEDMRLAMKYVTIGEPEKKAVGGKLAGRSFCFTGAASRPRKELWELVEKNGGIIHENMKKDTDFLITNDLSNNSNKIKKAQKFNIKILTEQEFYDLLN